MVGFIHLIDLKSTSILELILRLTWQLTQAQKNIAENDLREMTSFKLHREIGKGRTNYGSSLQKGKLRGKGIQPIKLKIMGT